MSLTYGEMFAGYDGLGMGVQSVLGGRSLWHAENDAAPSKILAFHWPDVPNLGDVTKVDWAAVAKVDVITGGSPCQDLSHAGSRAGMRAGTRSGLWSAMCDAIETIRPQLVVWENVRGALSADADSGMEPCPVCVGDAQRADFPPLRALGRVLGDLAELGYDSRVYGLSASDVGAPHGRFRVFVFAHPAGDPWRFGNGDDGVAADADGFGHERAGVARGRRSGPADDRLAAADAESQGRQGLVRAEAGPGGVRRRPADPDGTRSLQPPADATGDGRDEGWAEPARLVGGSDAAQRGDTPPADALGCGRDRRPREPVRGEVERAATARGGEVAGAPADTASRCGQDEPVGRAAAGLDVSTIARSGSGDSAGDPAEGVHGRGPVAPVVDWGQYAPAIHRWEYVLGRPAPAPTEAGPKGGQRLSPAFVEWLMGLPAGHVTDPAIRISRNDQLKALGNGVVPQQAAAATRMWLADVEAENAA